MSRNDQPVGLTKNERERNDASCIFEREGETVTIDRRDLWRRDRDHTEYRIKLSQPLPRWRRFIRWMRGL